MTSIALARKWRPRTFSQLLGQDHVSQALLFSLEKNQLHHAYLFTGTRGVGKTSVARMLAKAMNCEQRTGAEPCLNCDTCLAIEEGRCIDLIEIDGASKTRVEDTRELLDNIAYTPTHARFKIYLIDEVHMLSNHSFNALLKTLEEPPPHVKFLLATTDPQKIPLTVLSRCLQFHLKPLTESVISQHLAHVLNEEHIPFDPEALHLIAHAATGSMRDSLSLAEQAMAAGHGRISQQTVEQSLGITQGNYAQQLLHALANQSIPTVLEITQKINSQGAYFQQIMDDLLRCLHQMSLAQALGANAHALSINPEIIELSRYFSAEDTQLMYDITLKGSRDLALAPSAMIGFEMTVLRLHAFIPRQTPASLPPPAPSAEPIAQAAPSVTSTSPSLDWQNTVEKLNLAGLAAAALNNAEFISHQDNQVQLRIIDGHQALFNPGLIKKIEQQLSGHFNTPTTIKLIQGIQVSPTPAQNKQQQHLADQQDAELALLQDPVFQTLQQTFSGELIKGSIAPVKDRL